MSTANGNILSTTQEQSVHSIRTICPHLCPSNPYISNIWTEFRNTLVFDENVVLSNEKEDVVFENASQVISGIQTTVDSAYFFNEEMLVTSKLNYKFVQVTPTLLTGMGPLFTFMHIAFAFAHVDFSTNEATMTTISNNGNIASFNSDGYSESYLTPAQIQDVVKSKSAELDDIVRTYLLGVIFNEQHLMYLGVD